MLNTDVIHLLRKFTGSSVWSFLGSIFSNILYFLQTVILGRFFAPADLGLMRLLLFVQGIVMTFSDIDVGTAIVQKESIDRKTLNSGWFISFARGIIVTAILIITAPFFGGYFKEPSYSFLLRIFTITVVLSSAENIGMVILTRQMRFKEINLLGCIKALVNIICLFIFVYLTRNILGFVFGRISGSLLSLFISYTIQAHRPSFLFDRAELKGLIKFSFFIYISSIAFFLITQGDNFLVGRMLGTSALGYYALAYTVGNLPSSIIMGGISKIFLPFYSALKNSNNKESLENAYKIFFIVAFYISAFFTTFLIIFMPQIIKLFWGEKWYPSVLSAQIIAILGLFRVLAGLNAPLFCALDKPQILYKITYPNLVIQLLLLYFLIKTYGIEGASIAVTLSMAIQEIMCLYFVRSLINIRLLKLVPPLLRAISLNLVIFGLWYIIKNFVTDDSFYWIAMPFILLCIASYIFIALKIERTFKAFNIRQMLR